MTNKRKLIYLILVSLSIIAVIFVNYYPQYKAKNAVLSLLNDPESAQFEGIFINNKTGVVCGYVNAKNKMGGYAGRQLFIVSSSGAVDFDTSTTEEKLQRMDSNEKFSNPVLARCYQD
jgi:hypothetical protein